MNAKLDTDDADVKGEDARSVRFRTCCACNKCKPLTTDYFYIRDRGEGRKPEFRRECIPCRRLSCSKRYSSTRAKRANEAFAEPLVSERAVRSTATMCGECCNMPWRVTGPRCRRCKLPYAAEPAPEIELRRFDDIRTRC